MGDNKIPPVFQNLLAENQAMQAEFQALLEEKQKFSNIEPLRAIPANKPYLASSVYEALKKEIENFEKSLDDEHEISLELVPWNSSITMFVDSIDYVSVNLLIFYGTINGQNARIVQHINQLNFLMTSSVRQNKTIPPKHIGFRLPEVEN